MKSRKGKGHPSGWPERPPRKHTPKFENSREFCASQGVEERPGRSRKRASTVTGTEATLKGIGGMPPHPSEPPSPRPRQKPPTAGRGRPRPTPRDLKRRRGPGERALEAIRVEIGGLNPCCCGHPHPRTIWIQFLGWRPKLPSPPWPHGLDAASWIATRPAELVHFGFGVGVGGHSALGPPPPGVSPRVFPQGSHSFSTSALGFLTWLTPPTARTSGQTWRTGVQSPPATP